MQSLQKNLVRKIALSAEKLHFVAIKLSKKVRSVIVVLRLNAQTFVVMEDHRKLMIPSNVNGSQMLNAGIDPFFKV